MKRWFIEKLTAFGCVRLPGLPRGSSSSFQPFPETPTPPLGKTHHLLLNHQLEHCRCCRHQLRRRRQRHCHCHCHCHRPRFRSGEKCDRRLAKRQYLLSRWEHLAQRRFLFSRWGRGGCWCCCWCCCRFVPPYRSRNGFLPMAVPWLSLAAVRMAEEGFGFGLCSQAYHCRLPPLPVSLRL